MHKADRSIIAIHMMVILVISGLCMLMLPRIYGFSLFPDEFGYWTTAAMLTGRDWSQVASIGSYYTFGYGVILTPILLLFKDPVITYRAAILLNLVMQAGAYLILCDIADRLMPGVDRRCRTVLCGIAATYPAWSFYTQMTMAEGVLFFLYILSIWCVMRYLERPDVLRSVAAVITLIAMYCVHMRTVGVLIAGLIVIVVYGLMDAKSRDERIRTAGMMLVGLAVLVVLACIWWDIRNVHISKMLSYADDLTKRGNNYEGRIENLIKLSTNEGIWSLIKSILGKLLYFGCASYGYAFIGGYECLSALGRARNFGREEKVRPYLCVYMAVASLSQLAITSIGLLNSADITSDRLDLFLHGRYDDYIIPVLMMLGIYCIISMEHRGFREMVICGVIMTVLGVVAAYIVRTNDNHMSNPHRMLMIGMSYLAHDHGEQSPWYMTGEIGLSVFIMIVIWAVIRVYRRTGVLPWIMSVVMLQIILAYIASDAMIRPGQANIFGDIQLSEHLSDVRTDPGRRIVDLYEGNEQYADILQFCMRDETVTPIVVDSEETLNPEALRPDDYVLVDWQSSLRDELDDMYVMGYEMGHFALYYTP